MLQIMPKEHILSASGPCAKVQSAGVCFANKKVYVMRGV